MRANVKITFICTGTYCKLYLFTLGLWLPTPIIPKAPVATSAFIILLKQRGHKEKLISEHSEKLNTPEKMEAGPGCVRVLGCPLQFLCSPGLPLPDLQWHPQQELPKPRALCQSFAASDGNGMHWAVPGEGGGREAISNPPSAGMEPFAASSCGGSWKEGFLVLGCLLLLSFGRRTGGKRWIGI